MTLLFTKIFGKKLNFLAATDWRFTMIHTILFYKCFPTSIVPLSFYVRSSTVHTFGSLLSRNSSFWKSNGKLLVFFQKTKVASQSFASHKYRLVRKINQKGKLQRVAEVIAKSELATNWNQVPV